MSHGSFLPSWFADLGSLIGFMTGAGALVAAALRSRPMMWLERAPDESSSAPLQITVRNKTPRPIVVDRIIIWPAGAFRVAGGRSTRHTVNHVLRGRLNAIVEDASTDSFRLVVWERPDPKTLLVLVLWSRLGGWPCAGLPRLIFTRRLWLQDLQWAARRETD